MYDQWRFSSACSGTAVNPWPPSQAPSAEGRTPHPYACYPPQPLLESHSSATSRETAIAGAHPSNKGAWWSAWDEQHPQAPAA